MGIPQFNNAICSNLLPRMGLNLSIPVDQNLAFSFLGITYNGYLFGNGNVSQVSIQFGYEGVSFTTRYPIGITYRLSGENTEVYLHLGDDINVLDMFRATFAVGVVQYYAQGQPEENPVLVNMAYFGKEEGWYM